MDIYELFSNGYTVDIKRIRDNQLVVTIYFPNMEYVTEVGHEICKDTELQATIKKIMEE